MSNSTSSSIDLAGILKAGFPSYVARHGSPTAKQWKVINNVVSCRTSAFGGRIYKCDTCNITTVMYNSCRDRHCPKCQGVARAVWVQKRVNELLPVGYFHTVFTIPNSFNPFALQNKKVVYDLLFKAVSETLM